MNNKTLFLSQEDIVNCGGLNIELYIKAVREALILHSAGDYVQPIKPYVRRKTNYHIADRIIAMPSYVGGAFNVFGMKWIGSNADNHKNNLPRAIGTIILNDPVTKFPIAFMDGTIISAMRTAAVSALAVETLAKKKPKVLGLIGLGIICRWQLKAILKAAPTIETVRIYDVNPAAVEQFMKFARTELDRDLQGVKNLPEVFRDADIVVPCTTADKGYIEGDWIQKGQLFINVSIMDPKREVVLKADKIVVDDWIQCNRENKILNLLYQEGVLTDKSIYAELGQILAGKKAGRERDEEIIFFNPMGMSIEDIASAYHVYLRAKEQGIGTYLELFTKKSTPIWL